MHQNAAFTNVSFNKIIKRVEESSDVLVFAIEQRVHNMDHLGAISNMVHIFGGCHDCMSFELPVVMWLAWRKSRSRAAWMSPMKMRFLVGWKKTASELW